MERAKWNDLEISATDIASDYQKKAEIRKVSGKELICLDPECESPLLKYCHGEKKAHILHICMAGIATMHNSIDSRAFSVRY